MTTVSSFVLHMIFRNTWHGTTEDGMPHYFGWPSRSDFHLLSRQLSQLSTSSLRLLGRDKLNNKNANLWSLICGDNVQSLVSVSVAHSSVAGRSRVAAAGLLFSWSLEIFDDQLSLMMRACDALGQIRKHEARSRRPSSTTYYKMQHASCCLDQWSWGLTVCRQNRWSQEKWRRWENNRRQKEREKRHGMITRATIGGDQP